MPSTRAAHDAAATVDAARVENVGAARAGLAGLAGLEIHIPNLRDVGGWPTLEGGRVRRGLLFRSCDLVRIRGDVGAALKCLGVRRVFDLRTAAERRLWPEAPRLPGRIEYVVADVLRDAPEATPAQIVPLLSDPRRIEAVFGDDRGEAMFLRRYRNFINLSSARQGFHELLSDLATPGRTPALVHCTTGKDRTGWGVAILQLPARRGASRRHGGLPREVAAIVRAS